MTQKEIFEKFLANMKANLAKAAEVKKAESAAVEEKVEEAPVEEAIVEAPKKRGRKKKVEAEVEAAE